MNLKLLSLLSIEPMFTFSSWIGNQKNYPFMIPPVILVDIQIRSCEYGIKALPGYTEQHEESKCLLPTNGGEDR